MSTLNINDITNEKEKLKNLLSEIKFPRNFKKKLDDIYLTEFDEKFDQILLKKDSEFMNIFLKRVGTILEDMFSNDCFESEDLAILMKTNELEIYNKHYLPNFKLLNTALSSYNLGEENSENNENKKTDFFYDEDCMTIRDMNLEEEKDSNIILKQRVSSELTFRKHCRFIDDEPRHFCKNGNLTNFIKLRSLKQNGCITHLICTECKMAYKTSCVLLYCNFCSLSFYSTIKDSTVETSYLQPATWEKYHCSMIVNDQMRCIKCKDILFFDLKENLLKCFNDKCMFESDPYSIYWSCVTCKKEFQTNAKIYNPLEYKLVRSSIKEALIFKKAARPDVLPCCQDQILSDEMIFFHKKECNGRIFLGTMQNRQIIVCEKCRSLSNYDKFIWTCPSCGKRFKNKNIEKINGMVSFENKNEGKAHSKISSSTNLKYDMMVSSNRLISTNDTFNNFEMDENVTPLSGNTKEIGGSSIGISNRESFNPNSHRNLENSGENLVGSNSIPSHTSSENPNKIYMKSHINRDTDLKNFSSSNNNTISAENSLKGVSSNSIKTRENFELKENQSEYSDTDMLSYSNKLSKQKKASSQSSCSLALTSVEENSSSNYVIKNIRNFRHSRTLAKYDNEIESNPVSKSNLKYKAHQKSKVSFEDELKRNKNIKLLSNCWEENPEVEKSKSSKFLINNINMESETNNYNMSSNNTKNSILKNYNSISQYEAKLTTDFSIYNLSFNLFDIEEYTVDAQIGEGAYGIIYKIHDRKNNYFALKKNIIHDNDEMPTVMKQYIIMKKLSHPNILDLRGVSLQKLDSTTTSIYVLMDLAVNDWEKEIKSRGEETNETPKRYYTEKELIIILKQVTAALAYMQKMNVSHRDLKPHNILIFDNFVHKIADFGETQFLNENPFRDNNIQPIDIKSISGTELFMSPILYQALKEFKSEKEIINNPYKSDCFSLGLCILYAACLSLDVLYEIRKIGCNYNGVESSDNMVEKDETLLKNILSKELKSYSKHFEKLLNEMLNINEKRRPDFIELERILTNY